MSDRIIGVDRLTALTLEQRHALEATMRPRIHLQNPADRTDDVDGWSLCQTIALRWTRDPQAVTCPNCIDLMDLQPA